LVQIELSKLMGKDKWTRHRQYLSRTILLLLQNSFSLSMPTSRPRYMGENLLLSTAQGGGPPSSSLPSCPCCSFLPNALFLPPDAAQIESCSIIQDYAVKLDGMTPLESLSQISKASVESQKVLLVDTHGHPQLDRERHEAYIEEEESMKKDHCTEVVALSCAVSESDWESTLAYASRSEKILPGLGIHPWYLEGLSSTWLTDLETLLVQHPSAIVAEIGLCKIAKFVRSHPDGKAAALQMQRRVFLDQLQLAAKLKRPVSVHCVQQQGPFMAVMKEMVEEARKKTKKKSDDSNTDQATKLINAFPTAIGMHSFTGTAHHVKEILKFEKTWFPNQKLFYFGFSHAVNVAMCSSEKSRRQGLEAIRAVPFDRLMAESDVHTTEDVPAGTAGAIAYIAFALDKPLIEVAEMTASNGVAFLNTSITD